MGRRVIMELEEVLRNNEARRRIPSTYGITTADKYLLTLAGIVGTDNCYRWWSRGKDSFWDLLSRSSKLLVYSDPGMVVEAAESNAARWKGLMSDVEGVELPKNTLIVFRHVLTTSRRDREGDVLRSDGAVVDPKMLLLWQHVPVNPIGKYLATVQQDRDRLVVLSAVVDISPLSHDAAVMIENGMGRFSHGFRALEWEAIRERGENGEEFLTGYDVKRFEILEESLVSVPANPDAEVEEVLLGLNGKGRFRSNEMKTLCKSLADRRKGGFSVTWFLGGEGNGVGREGIGGVAGKEDDFVRAGKAEAGAGSEGGKKAQKIGREEKPMKSGKAEPVQLNKAGLRQAEQLIKQGKYILEDTWEPPSADEENAFIEENGMEDFSRWFLGVRPNVDPENKGAWAYPYSNDFRTVHRKGLIAIRQRAGQQGEEDIFDAAGRLIEMIDTAEAEGGEKDEQGKQRQKAGRALSKENEGFLKDAVEDLVEVEGMKELSRAAKALVQSARWKVERVLKAAERGSEDEDGEDNNKGSGLSLREVIFDREKRERLKALISYLDDKGGDHERKN